MNFLTQSRKFRHLSVLTPFLIVFMMAAPAMGANLLDQIMTARAAKIQIYISKAFKRIDEADKPAYKELLAARLHVCALVNKLLQDNSGEDGAKRAAYEVRHGVFTKLAAAMSEDYTPARRSELAAAARVFIRQKLLRSDNARQQIIFNSCLDIRSGKISHALSNMEKQLTLTTTEK